MEITITGPHRSLFGAAAAVGLALTGLAAPIDAEACGGFFCNRDTPVNQNAERIVFGIDTESNTTDVHVQIFYSGDGPDFAWVLPVPQEPELFLSTDALFQTLDWQTRPQFNLTWEEWGDCYPDDMWNRFGGDDVALNQADPTDSDGEAGGVTVVSSQNVGPYQTVVLQATDETELIEWLQGNNYDIPDAMSSVLAPYVAGGQYFVALRLAKDNDAGDIAPIGMRYSGTTPAIPIQLTSVAATPDMRLEVYVFGGERAVPENYLHVQINEAAINWMTGGGNYNDVITAAANEAGGHAFATDYSGGTANFRGSLFAEGRFNLDAIRGANGSIAIMDLIMGQGFPASTTLMDILMDHMPVPSGVDPQSYYNCVSCYANQTVDGNALADDLEEFMIAPLERAEELYQYPQLTRMTSSISPIEMTVDPMFVQNATMGDVANVRDADLIMDCRSGRDWYTARRRVVLSDGRVILVPSQEFFDTTDVSTDAFFEGATEVNALIIEQTSADGDPVVLTDNTDFANQQLDESNDEVSANWGCGGGCNASGSPLGGFALLPLGALLLRRRRS